MSSALREIPPLLNKRDSLARRVNRAWPYYVFVSVGILYFVIIRYLPVYFVQVAFRDYRITLPVTEAPWAGFRYFGQLLSSRDFLLALKNSIIINIYQLVFGFPAPIILAVMLHEVPNLRFKRITQTIVYLPHFISWVVIGGILFNLLSLRGGLVNEILASFGADPVPFLSDNRYFRGILIGSGVWKGAGWGTIVYLATMSSINPELYESAMIDGASRIQRILNITIPGIVHVITVLLIIQIGRLLNYGLDQVMILFPRGAYGTFKETGLTLEWYVYYQGLVQYRYSFAAAAGLFQTLVAFLMVFSADRLAKRLGQEGIF